MNIKKQFQEHISNLTNFEEYKKAISKFPRKSLRVNTIKISIKDLKQRLNLKEQVPWCKEGFFIDKQLGKTDEHLLGYFFIQEASAMLPATLLDPKEDDKVLDLCAAPGSKTTQIAQMMNNKGLIIANDINNKRLDILKQNLQRLGIQNTAIKKNYKPNIQFDKVLVDAPCSGSGKINLTTTKGQRILNEWNPKNLKRITNTQKELILKGFDSLKSNGTLVYSTCSIEPEENENIIKYLLENRKAKLITQKRIWPQDNNTEGFFAAKLLKIN